MLKIEKTAYRNNDNVLKLIIDGNEYAFNNMEYAIELNKLITKLQDSLRMDVEIYDKVISHGAYARQDISKLKSIINNSGSFMYETIINKEYQGKEHIILLRIPCDYKNIPYSSNTDENIKNQSEFRLKNAVIKIEIIKNIFGHYLEYNIDPIVPDLFLKMKHEECYKNFSIPLYKEIVRDLKEYKLNILLNSTNNNGLNQIICKIPIPFLKSFMYKGNYYDNNNLLISYEENKDLIQFINDLLLI